jgi:hypothetical protein
MRIPMLLAAACLPATMLSAQQAPSTRADLVASPSVVTLAGTPPTLAPAAALWLAESPNTSLDRSLSASRRYSVGGGVVGFVVGAAAGGALGCLANKDDYGVFCGGQDDTKVFVGAALGAAAGAVLGAVLLRRH